MTEQRSEHIATETQPFHFIGSGLPNVYLIGIRYFVHPDGRTVPVIPALKQLMQLIARNLITTPTPLTGEEIRFLRKRLGEKQVEFARSLGIEPESLCRWENGTHNPSEPHDKLIRLYYALCALDDAHLNDLRKEIHKLLVEWRDTQASAKKKPVTAKVTNDEWELAGTVA